MYIQYIVYTVKYIYTKASTYLMPFASNCFKNVGAKCLVLNCGTGILFVDSRLLYERYFRVLSHLRSLSYSKLLEIVSIVVARLAVPPDIYTDTLPSSADLVLL